MGGVLVEYGSHITGTLSGYCTMTRVASSNRWCSLYFCLNMVPNKTISPSLVYLISLTINHERVHLCAGYTYKLRFAV
jgi:hypothetical protein